MCFANLLFTFISIVSCTAAQDKPHLVWTSSSSQQRTTDVLSALAFPTESEKSAGKVVVNKIASLRYPHFLSILASNDVTQELTAVDIGQGNIITFSSRDRSIVRHHGGVSRKVSGIAVDWSNGNIYWADEARHWIVAAKWNLMRMKPIICEISEPRAVAVHPQQGYLYWTEINNGFTMPGKIMRSTLSGADKNTVHSSIGTPSSLSVDYKESRLYWIDANDGSLWSCDTEGKFSPKSIYVGRKSSFTSLAVYQGKIFVADNAKNEILMISKELGNVEDRLEAVSPFGLVITGGDIQDDFSGPCDIKNGGCEEFCFPQPPGNVRKCNCSLGLVLASDGTSCISDFINDDFFVAVDSDMHLIFQISHDGSRYTRLNLPGIKVPVQVEFNPETKMVYWTDVGTRSVNSAKWDGSDFKILAKENVRQPTGLALDSMSGNLYWTDEGTGTINVIRIDGTHRKTILSDNIKSPRAIVVDPFTGTMWWSDWTMKTLERASMDGSNRTVIVDEDVNWPNGIAIDQQEERIYWVDAHTDAIYSSNLAGRDKRVFKKFTDNVHMFGISVNKEYVYWTDWNSPSVMRISKQYPHGHGMAFGPQVFSKLCDIYGFIDTRDITELEMLSHPCRVNNGNCTGLCIPVPSNQPTQATNGKRFQVTRVCMCGSEHEGQCDKPHQGVSDTTPPSFNGTCPGNMSFTAPPCEDKVLVNYAKPKATDDSGRLALTTAPKFPPPVYLGKGKYKHRYVVTDAAGNTDSCLFTITVHVVKCAPVQSYLKDFEYVRTTGETCENKYGSRLNLTCPDGMKMTATGFVTCDINGRWQGKAICYKPPDKASIEPTIGDVSRRHTITNSSGATPTAGYLGESYDFDTTLPTKTSTTKTQNKDAESINNGQRTLDLELTYLIIPGIVVLLITIIAAVGYHCCKNKSLPLLETIEKHLTLNSLRQEDRDQGPVAFSNVITQRHGRSPSVTSITEEQQTRDDRDLNISNRASMTTPSVSTVPQTRCPSTDPHVIYSEPSVEFHRGINDATPASESYAGTDTDNALPMIYRPI